MLHTNAYSRAGLPGAIFKKGHLSHMAATPPQVVQLTCPNCRAPVRAQVFTLIDVGRQPELKNYLLAGQINVAVCQSCGFTGMLSTPMIYHDPAKQLLLVFFPQQGGMRPEEQERLVGEATSAIMRDLPADAPRGYLLAPRRFLTLTTLLETILEADGISREEIESYRKQSETQSKIWELIVALVGAYEQGEEQLAALVEQNKDRFDQEFFASFNQGLAELTAQRQTDDLEMLSGLRDKLVELTGFDIESLDEIEDEDPDVDALVDMLIDLPDDELDRAIPDIFPSLDYSFFSAWTERIEEAAQAGDAALAERLTVRRAHILEVVEQANTAYQAQFEAGTALLNEVAAADDPEAALREQRARIDKSFLEFLDAKVEIARGTGDDAGAERLAEIRRLATQIGAEALSPEERLIDELLHAETPQAATKLLRQNTPMVTTAFVKQLNALAEQYETDGRKADSDRLRQLGRESAAMLF